LGCRGAEAVRTRLRRSDSQPNRLSDPDPAMSLP
jgi:hypothetical protein